MGIFSKKEKVEKQPETTENAAPVQEQPQENGTSNGQSPTPPPPVEEKVEKQPETVVKSAIAPINISYDLKGKIAVTGVRVVNGQLIYNDGLKVVRVPVSKDKPVTITIRQ